MKTVFGTALLLLAATAASGATVQAVAGVGGVTKPGRWTPLVVSVTGADGPLDAELDVSWGDLRLRRPITVAAGARKDFELYLRTRDARSSIDVRLVGGGREVARVAAPVRVLGADDPVTLCVRADAAEQEGAACTAWTLASELPRSPRGYEAVDRVEWPGGRARLAPDQEAALRAWQSLEDLAASGDLGLGPHVSRPLLPRGLPQPLVPVVLLASLGYLTALVVPGLVLRARRAQLAWSVGAFAAVTLGACAAVGAIGRVGATRAVRVHHVSVLHQLPGTDDAVLSIRGVAEFPSFDRFSLRLPAADAMLETFAETTAEQRADADGFPVVTGVFGLAGRQSFAGEAVVRAQPLLVVERGQTVEIENRSNTTLRECRFGRGVSGQAAELAPGARMTATWSDAGADDGPAGPLLACAMDDAPVAFTEARRPVIMQGVTTVAVYRAPTARGTFGD